MYRTFSLVPQGHLGSIRCGSEGFLRERFEGGGRVVSEYHSLLFDVLLLFCPEEYIHLRDRAGCPVSPESRGGYTP